MTFTGNDLARCTTTHGFWPNGGSYGVDVDVNCQGSGTYAQSNVTWSGNFWDDSGSNVACQ